MIHTFLCIFHGIGVGEMALYQEKKCKRENLDR